MSTHVDAIGVPAQNAKHYRDTLPVIICVSIVCGNLFAIVARWRLRTRVFVAARPRGRSRCLEPGLQRLDCCLHGNSPANGFRKDTKTDGGYHQSYYDSIKYFTVGETTAHPVSFSARDSAMAEPMSAQPTLTISRHRSAIESRTASARSVFQGKAGNRDKRVKISPRTEPFYRSGSGSRNLTARVARKGIRSEQGRSEDRPRARSSLYLLCTFVQ